MCDDPDRLRHTDHLQHKACKACGLLHAAQQGSRISITLSKPITSDLISPRIIPRSLKGHDVNGGIQWRGDGCKEELWCDLDEICRSYLAD